MSSSSLTGQRVVLFGAILLAYALAILYLLWRRHGGSLLRLTWVPAGLFAVFAPLDALVTLQGTWNFPWQEAEPTMRAFLLWQGWRGVCIGFVAWILGGVLFVDALEAPRLRLNYRGRTLVGWLQIYTLYALAMGDLDGLLSWTQLPTGLSRLFSAVAEMSNHWLPWSIGGAGLGYLVGPSLFFGALCTVTHIGVKALARSAALRARFIGVSWTSALGWRLRSS